ncbi:MAG: ThuA domain-containing protein [Bacteroidetes bacterium]|nr:ThuA domain-containing protein [Bacteroidota bacterium]
MKTVLFALMLALTMQVNAQTRVLVFSKTAAFRHSSIEVAKLALLKIGSENNIKIDTTESTAVFTEEGLKKYSAVVFLSTTGDVLNNFEQAVFERYIQAGGGYVGIHAATDCEYTWPWYGKLSGAYFKSHPDQQKAKLVINDNTHPSTAHLPAIWERFDEWYNFKTAPGSEVKVLISIDEKSYVGGSNGINHPMAWYHDYDGGRAFYTELGHTDESYSDPLYLKHLLGGIKYAIGNNVKLNYSKVKSNLVPEEDRFTKNILAGGMFDEPTEMAILPNLDILIVQRKGEVMFYNHLTKKVTQVAKLDVYHKSNAKGVNAEEGLIGVTADPNYAKNNFVYLFYATKDTAANRLSRFVLKNGILDRSSEKKIIDVGTTRDICCHTAGSLSFGPDGTLFVSTGDNTTPFDQPNSKYVLEGYGPIDNRAGFEQYDGRRGSSNTNDLRGKVLRLKINSDATYSIPEGNLFKPGTPKTRPEIYAMGTRNPYRISIDRKNGFLYWGDVGPDAGENKMSEKGPRGYDELNQARKAGYFGYPLFIGGNYPYRQFDYTTGVVGDFFDPQKPMNLSKNNTGLVELPPVSPAFIWYPYANSPEFPEVGSGGRNAMAGPIYYPEFYPKETRYPAYFNGKLLFYEWIRGWLKLVSMDEAGNYQQMEPFMPNTKFNSEIDIEVGPDGRYYVLEYGSGWFSKNADAALSRIDYNGGNRAPKASIHINKLNGAIPFTIQADAIGSTDADGDALTYIWSFGNQIKKTKTNATPFTFNKAGEYAVSVAVQDAKGAITKSEVIKIYAGNESPAVEIKLTGNDHFYYPGAPIPYMVNIKDKEDGSTEKGGIDNKSIYVKVDYLSGPDKAQVVGHQVMTALMEGKNLVATLDCKSCHKEAEKSIGPSFAMISDKYKNDLKNKTYLSNKIIKGGSGVWGAVAMAAHPNLKQEELDLIIDWILSVNKKKEASLPSKGNIIASAEDMGPENLMQITASYTDKGGIGIKPLSASNSITLRSALINMSSNNMATRVNVNNWKEYRAAFLNGEEGWLEFSNFNLDDIKSIELSYGIPETLDKGYIITLYQDEPSENKSNKIAELKLANAQSSLLSKTVLDLQNVKQGQHKLFLKIQRVDKLEKNRLAVISMKLIQKK